MKDKGILLTDENAWLAGEGRKSQTRRVMRVQPPTNENDWRLIKLLDTTGDRRNIGKHQWAKVDNEGNIILTADEYFSCPYVKGQRLYRKEAWNWGKRYDSGYVCFINNPGFGIPPIPEWAEIFYKADNTKMPSGFEKWIPSAQMPKWAARSWYRVTEDPVPERVQDITHCDIYKEGIDVNSVGKEEYPDNLKTAFINLWNSIYKNNDTKSWQANPWVWVVKFEQIQGD